MQSSGKIDHGYENMLYNVQNYWYLVAFLQKIFEHNFIIIPIISRQFAVSVDGTAENLINLEVVVAIKLLIQP